MTTDYDVRAALRAVAEDAEIGALSGPAIRRRAAGRARAGWVMGVLAGTAAALAGIAMLSGVRHEPPPPVASSYLAWPARGNLAGDDAYVSAAVDAWDAPGEAGPLSREVRLLYATTTSTGPLVVLAGHEPDGERRVAAFRGTAHEPVFSGRLAKFYDAVPERDDLLVLPMQDVVGLPGMVAVVASPEATSIEWAGDTEPDFFARDGAGWSVVGSLSGLRVRVREGDREIVAEVPPVPPPVLVDRQDRLRPYAIGPSWISADRGALPEGTKRSRDLVRRAAYTRGRSAEPGADAVQLWSARLPDDVEVFAEVVRPGESNQLVVAARNGNVVDFYVEQPLPRPPDLYALALVVRGATMDWLVVVTPADWDSSVEFALHGTTYTGVPMQANVALAAFPHGKVTPEARVRLTTPEGAVAVPISAFPQG